MQGLAFRVNVRFSIATRPMGLTPEGIVQRVGYPLAVGEMVLFAKNVCEDVVVCEGVCEDVVVCEGVCEQVTLCDEYCSEGCEDLVGCEDGVGREDGCEEGEGFDDGSCCEGCTLGDGRKGIGDTVLE